MYNTFVQNIDKYKHQGNIVGPRLYDVLFAVTVAVDDVPIMCLSFYFNPIRFNTSNDPNRSASLLYIPAWQ